MSAELTWVCTVAPDAVAADNPLRTRAAGIPIVIYEVQNEYYATAEFCTHGNASLGDGYLDGYLIECPLHQGLFDVRTGEAKAPPCTVALRSYPTKVEGDRIWIGVTFSAPSASLS
jgi:naphthalene 1,2-dioxygenase ferredoxin component